MIGSVAYTSNKMLEVTGKRQFSAFGGWQLANNALYMYEHIPASQRGAIPARFAKLEGMVREHMDTDGTIDRTGETGGNTRLAVIGESPRTGALFLLAFVVPSTPFEHHSCSSQKHYPETAPSRVLRIKPNIGSNYDDLERPPS